MKVEKDEFLTDGGKSAMMTMRRRPMTERTILDLRQPKFKEKFSERMWVLYHQFPPHLCKHGCIPAAHANSPDQD